MLRSARLRASFGQHRRSMGPRTPKKKLVAALVVVAALGVCGYVTARHRVQPEPPPRGAATALPSFLESESSLDVPIAIDASWIAGVADARLPRMLLSRSDVTVAPGVKAEVEVRRDGEVTASADDGALHLRVPVAADIEARWTPRGWLGAPPWGDKRVLRLHPTFTIDAQLRLGVDAEWNLETETEATLRWEEDPVVPLGPLQVPLSSLVGDAVREQFEATMRSIDERIATRVPMRRLLGEAWASAFRVLPIGPGGRRWLVMRPAGLYLGDVNVRDGGVFVDAGIRGVFRVVVGEEPKGPTPEPLPERSDKPVRSGLALEVPVRVTFEALNRELDARVEGQTIELRLREASPPVRLTIESLDLYASGTQVAVALEFAADIPYQPFDVAGRIYLLGTPSLDVERDELRISDLSYDARTNVILLDIAEWMLHAEILRRLEERLILPFSDRISGYRSEVNDLIGDYALSESFRLHGRIDEIKVTALTVTDASIIALAVLRGEAALEVRPAP